MRKILASFLILSGLISFGQNSTIEDLWMIYDSHDFKSVISKAKPLLENDTNNLDLNLVLGRAYTEQGDFTDAVPYLEFTVKNDIYNSSRKAWALGYLGTCYFMLQKYDDSEKSLNECIRLNSTKNATNNAYANSLLFGFHEFYENWEIVETDNFRFHFQNMNAAEIVKYTSVREQAYKEINGFFKSTLPKKIDFYVWNSKDDAKRILGADLGFSKPNFCIVHTHYQQTIGHEMTHVISNYTSEITNKTRFINEGTAVCFDQSNQDRLKLVKDWISTNNKPVAVKDYWAMGEKYAEEILYRLSGLFVKELIDNFGKDKFLEFFKNQTYEYGKFVFGDKLDTVIQEFEIKINT
ncbi:MAG: tetratricopeptide repeat protein [Bacteroidales bacterium]|nr:tetratricopeptide repeat protein [Bacteroidales bacterium]